MKRDVVVVGASAGGVAALLELVGGLPAGFGAAVFVAIHTSPDGPGVLPSLLERRGPLPASYPKDGEKVRMGRIYVAPRDRHMLLDKGVIRVTTGPKENGFRPAVDPLFRSAAAAYGPRVVGLVMSGGLDDGTQGLIRIKSYGGVSVVQDPDDAYFPSMPLSAIANDHVDTVARLKEIPAVLVQYTSEPIPEGAFTMAKRQHAVEPDPAAFGDTALKDKSMPVPPSGLTCPDCGGALWELKEGRLTRYRCHVGHQYTPDGLEQAQAEEFETAMWSALRALEERAELKRRMAGRVEHLRGSFADDYRKQADETEKQATLLRRMLLHKPDVTRKPKAEELAIRREAAKAKRARPGLVGKNGRSKNGQTKNGRAKKQKR
jgi:two-component system chemotaxis response regulator CheB